MFCGFTPFCSPIINVHGINTAKIHFSMHTKQHYAFLNISILPEIKVLQSYHVSNDEISSIIEEVKMHTEALLHMTDCQLEEVGYYNLY